MMAELHRGAALFGADARRLVANGPLFDLGHHSGVTRADGCCVVGALIATERPDLRLATPSFLPGREEVEGATGALTDREWLHVCALMIKNDWRNYADPIAGRANLLRDLLGVEA